MITSGQVSQMHMMSMQQHGGMRPGGIPMAPSMGPSQYPPTFSYSMAGAQNPNEQFGSRMVGAGLGASKAVLGAAGMAHLGMGAAGLGMAGLAAAGIGSGPPGWLALGGGLMAAGGIAAATAPVTLMAAGHQRQAQVNQIFGNQQFANPMNPAGRGFDRGQLRSLYGAVRAIDQNDPFVSMGDALRVTQRFGSEFGMQQGVRDAEKLAKRVTELGKTLARMAKTMGTTIDEAGEIMGMSRQAGFYTADDVMGNTQTFMRLRGKGFTSQQTAGIQTAGAGMARSQGFGGQAGARFASGMVESLTTQMQMGLMDENMLMDATGTTTRNDAAAAMAQRMQGVFQQTAQNPYGRLVMASLMQTDGDGQFTGINQGLLRDMKEGRVGVDQLRAIGQSNLNRPGGREAFVNNLDQITGGLMGSEDGMSGLLRAIEKSAEDGNKDIQILMQQVTGMNSRDYRLVKDAVDNSATARAQLLRDSATELQMQGRQQFLREHTFGGIVQNIGGSIMDRAISPMVDYAGDVTNSIGRSFDDMRLGSLAMLGRGTATFATSQSQASDLADDMMRMHLGQSIDPKRRAMITGAGTSTSPIERATMMAMAGNQGGLGRALSAELDTDAVDRMSPDSKRKIRELSAQVAMEQDPSRRAELLREMRAEVGRATGKGMTTTTRTVGSIRDGTRRTETVRSFDGTGEENAIDAIIAEVAGDTGLAAVRKGRAADPNLSASTEYDTVKRAQDQLQGLITDEASVGGVIAGGVLGLIGGTVTGIMTGTGPVAQIGGMLAGAEYARTRGWGGKQLSRELQEGKGVELMSKARTARGMRNIDRIITAARNSDKNPAEALSEELGIEVTDTDLEVYEAAMAQATGTSSSVDRYIEQEANPDVDMYGEDGEFSKGVETGNIAAEISDSVLGERGVLQVQRVSTTLERELGDVQGVEEALDALKGTGANATATQVGLDSFVGDMEDVIQKLAESTITSEGVVGKSAETQLLVRQAEKVRSIGAMVGTGRMSGQKLIEELGVDRDSVVGQEILRKAGRDGLEREEAMELAATFGAGQMTGLTLEGTAAMATAAAQGKTPMQIQAESVQKTAEMIDALYAKLSGTSPQFPDSSIAQTLTAPDGDT